MKLVASVSLTAGSLLQKLESGLIRELIIEFAGTNAAAQTMAAADLGTLEILRRGESLHRIDISQLQSIDNLKGGQIRAESTVADVFNFTAILPFYLYGDSLNIMHVTPADNFRIEITFAATMAAKLLAGSSQTCKVYAVEGLGVMEYLYRLRKYDIACAAGDIPVNLPAKNVIGWFVENDTNVSKFVVSVDGDKQFEVSRDVLITSTHFHNKLETWSATYALLEFDLLPTGQLNEGISDNVQAVITAAAAGTLNTVIASLDFDVEAKSRSLALSENKLRSKLSNVTQVGDAAAVLS